MPTQNPTLGFLLHEVARLLRRSFELRSGHSGLTRSQFQTIAYLMQNEGINQSGLADLLDIEPVTLVRILDTLEERGLIERRPHPTDRRCRQLYLTATARPMLDAMQPLGEATRAQALQGVSEEDRVRLYRTLTQMKTNLMAVTRPANDPVAVPMTAKKEAHYG
jgi:DNA-binding MarR family transcriptional regulator